MLASDQDGEVAGAARAIGRALAADNLDFHDLARILIGRSEGEFRQSEDGDARPSHRHADAPDGPPEDRRFETRFRKVLQAGKILLPSGGILDCRLRNRSANGALLELASLIGVPDQFILRVPSTDEMFGVQVIWRGDREIGVRRL
ncbi:hypothetical protein [Methylobacterium sp. J-076]|uniref:hypothetical protein n=1 Tax=Methylobacterium sp. J-076 TaxID=2836655 RepID=UPI001FB93A9B|nr:hypothetical protein [Methylobacterium sp. J-076]